MFLAIVAIIVLFFWFGFRKTPPQIDFSDLRERVRKYSGLDRDSYIQFDENMDEFIKRKDTRYLYQAIESARNIGLSIINPDDGYIRDELNLVADEIGIRGEKYVNMPTRYLNNTIDNKGEEDVDLYDPFWARREAAGEIRTNRRG
jgi:hypothetical protein